MGNTISLFFPPDPELTEANLTSQEGRVFIVTGGASGVGYELCRMLYQSGGKVYIAGRSEANGQAAIAKIKASSTSSSGDLSFLHLVLDDYNTIKPAVDLFTKQESRLDVLFNNAGVSNPPTGSVGAQGQELQLATNCLGPYLLTQLLVPLLRQTAKTTALGSTRVVWTSSIVTDLGAPKGGIDLNDLARPPTDQNRNYTTSKTGNWFLADALAKQVGSDGVLSIVVNPGNLKTALTRHFSSWVPMLVGPLLYEARFGAYTNIWAGLSPRLNIGDGGKFVLPWGRPHPSPREDILEAMKSKDQGGTGIADAFLEVCAQHTRDYM